MSSPHSGILLDRMMSLHPKIIDMTLDRMWRILAALDHPERRIPPVIHIAGTNGKGSTLAMIRAGLEDAGQHVHAYTSPHLARFHERIRLAGEVIDEQALAHTLGTCLAANGPDPITYFEITTAAAFQAFAGTPADMTLLEVGLGGRLDATNVINKPKLTVITPIDLDHQQFLGDTIMKIAGEKAGILKCGVPCIVGPQQDAAMDVIESVAAKLGTPLLAHGRHWHVREEGGRLIFQDAGGRLNLPLPNLIGPHQIMNSGVALATLRQLDMGPESAGAACHAAVTRAEWPARMQRLRHGPLQDAAPEAEIWLDGGHNPHAAAALVATLGRLPKRPTYVICGMLNTKDVAGFLRPLGRIAIGFQTVDIKGQAATLPAAETARIARSQGFDAQPAGSAAAALHKIIAKAPRARVVICGSLYLAGIILQDNG
ncbi:MAG: bifunctional folylpolyglutamate synthase/dihydrofolate synthase [Rhodobacteraceae bacterium]|nr:bifunctional folylpolyglutamate synthase/dihydrofolate synthase [Paracoccaceae bacterium]